jgi:hypothetical protein
LPRARQSRLDIGDKLSQAGFGALVTSCYPPGMVERLEPFDEFADISTERLLKLRDEYRAGLVELVEREPDAEVRARLNAVNGKMLAAIEAKIEKRMSAQ